MATPYEKLAESLEVLHKLQNANGAAAIRARDLTRTHRERLLKNGFLREVMKGWYVPGRPDDGKGESTAWYASFRRFASACLEHRFQKNWSLSPEQVPCVFLQIRRSVVFRPSCFRHAISTTRLVRPAKYR